MENKECIEWLKDLLEFKDCGGKTISTYDGFRHAIESAIALMQKPMERVAQLVTSDGEVIQEWTEQMQKPTEPCEIYKNQYGVYHNVSDNTIVKAKPCEWCQHFEYMTVEKGMPIGWSGNGEVIVGADLFLGEVSFCPNCGKALGDKNG